MNNFKIVKVDYRYCDFLREYDNRVVYNAGSKELRPFIGVLFSVNNCEYFAPLSSPKEKHLHMKNQLDLVKINNGKMGVINLNNMIPVTSQNYELFDLNSVSATESEAKRQKLLKEQLFYLNRNRATILNKAVTLYEKYCSNKLPKSIKDRCCDFLLLEKISIKYNMEN